MNCERRSRAATGYEERVGEDPPRTARPAPPFAVPTCTMSPYSSRYIRPEHPAPIVLTSRDREFLHVVYRHRYVTQEHLRDLICPDTSRRRVQTRLRQLWENGYLDRHYVPVLLMADKAASRQSAGRPVYILATKGAKVVAEDLGIGLKSIPHTPAENARGFATFEHHLVVTDFLVALEAACKESEDIKVVRIERESDLRRLVAAWHVKTGTRHHPYLVSDGAVTLTYPLLNRTWTFHLEVVRAGVPGGNQTLYQKMLKYTRLHHSGYFRIVFHHEDLRAVLILTTSEERVERFRELARRLPHGSRMFWFASYTTTYSGGVPVTSIGRETVLGVKWRTATDDGQPVGLAGVSASQRQI